MFLILRLHMYCIHCFYICLISFALSLCEIHFPSSNTQCILRVPSNALGSALNLSCLRRTFISEESFTPQAFWGVSLCNNSSHNLESTISILKRIAPAPPTLGNRLFLDDLLNKPHIFLLSPFSIHLAVNDRNWKLPFCLCFFPRWTKNHSFRSWCSLFEFKYHFIVDYHIQSPMNQMSHEVKFNRPDFSYSG